MRKSFKITMVVSVCMLLLLGLALAQIASAEKKADVEQYRDALTTFFSSNNIAYDYQAKFNMEDTSGLSSSGRIIKCGQDFVDSNEQYYKIMVGNTFMNVDFGMRSVFLVDIPKMEQRMGFVRSDLNSNLLNVTDSNFAAL